MIFQQIKRELKYIWQKLTRGWSDKETWSLDVEFCKWILPRLKRFKKLSISYPSTLRNEKNWDKRLDEMIEGFSLYVKYQESCESIPESDKKKIKKAFTRFAKWHEHLWW